MDNKAIAASRRYWTDRARAALQRGQSDLAVVLLMAHDVEVARSR